MKTKKIFKHTEETKRKIGLANRVNTKKYWEKNKPSIKQKNFQKKKIEERCKKCGIIIYNKNRNHSCKEIADKLSKINKGRVLSLSTRLKISKSNMGKHKKGEPMKMELRKKISAIKQGVDYEEWKGFKEDYSRRLRKSSMWKIWRESVFLRDKFICQNKNCKFCNNKIGVMLHPHHIKSLSKYPKLVFNIDNGITYCEMFHIKSGLHKRIMQREK